jgi:hypothetical protein
MNLWKSGSAGERWGERKELRVGKIDSFASGELLFISAVPNTKLCAWGEEDSGGHVL